MQQDVARETLIIVILAVAKLSNNELLFSCQPCKMNSFWQQLGRFHWNSFAGTDPKSSLQKGLVAQVPKISRRDGWGNFFLLRPSWCHVQEPQLNQGTGRLVSKSQGFMHFLDAFIGLSHISYPCQLRNQSDQFLISKARMSQRNNFGGSFDFFCKSLLVCWQVPATLKKDEKSSAGCGS